MLKYRNACYTVWFNAALKGNNVNTFVLVYIKYINITF